MTDLSGDGCSISDLKDAEAWDVTDLVEALKAIFVFKSGMEDLQRL